MNHLSHSRVHSRAVHDGGFTLVEMLIAMMAIIALIATTLPAIVTAQRRYDNNFTMNVLQSLHNTCSQNARQLGSACVIYGYTLEFTDGIVASGKKVADDAHPWVIVNDTLPAWYQSTSNDLQADIGYCDLWRGDRLCFTGSCLPGSTVTIDGTTVSTSTSSYLHVAFEPRTGFVHAVMNNSPTPSFTCGGAMGITGCSSRPDSVVILCDKFSLNISSAGAVDVRTP